MTVGQLVEELLRLPQDMKVVCMDDVELRDPEPVVRRGDPSTPPYAKVEEDLVFL